MISGQALLALRGPSGDNPPTRDRRGPVRPDAENPGHEVVHVLETAVRQEIAGDAARRGRRREPPAPRPRADQPHLARHRRHHRRRHLRDDRPRPPPTTPARPSCCPSSWPDSAASSPPSATPSSPPWPPSPAAPTPTPTPPSASCSPGSSAGTSSSNTPWPAPASPPPGRNTSMNYSTYLFSWKIPAFLCNDPFTHVRGPGSNLPALLITLAVTAILVIGIRESATTNAVLVGVKVGVVLFVIGVGVFFINPANWTSIPHDRPDLPGGHSRPSRLWRRNRPKKEREFRRRAGAAIDRGASGLERVSSGAAGGTATRRAKMAPAPTSIAALDKLEANPGEVRLAREGSRMDRREVQAGKLETRRNWTS